MKTIIRLSFLIPLLVLPISAIDGRAASKAGEQVNLITDGSFEDGHYAPGAFPFGWIPDAFQPTATLVWDATTAHDGQKSVKISAPLPNDARWIQTNPIPVEQNALYALSGWIKTQAVAHSEEAVDAGANLSVFGTFTHSPGIIGTRDWTYESMIFNTGASSHVTVAARLGYWSGTTSGTAWFDDLQLAPLKPVTPHPHWRILVLIYGETDFTYSDSFGVGHRLVASMTADEKARAAEAATRFVEHDIPALTSGNMVPWVTIRFADHPLGKLSPCGDGGWWPAPADTATDRYPEVRESLPLPPYDAAIVIHDVRVTDQATGERKWVGCAGGLTPDMGTLPTYAAIIIEAATQYGHLNVFKHEWGHSILSFFDAAGLSPSPAVSNHAVAGQYVHCGTGRSYLWQDETDANPIPNSIYNNISGFTHDYYSGTTATADQPNRCLGITPKAWSYGGPISNAGLAWQQQVQIIAGRTDDLVKADSLDRRRAVALQAQLSAAIRAFDQDHSQVAAMKLRDFIADVQRLRKGGNLPDEQAQSLIDAAAAIIFQVDEQTLQWPEAIKRR